MENNLFLNGFKSQETIEQKECMEMSYSNGNAETDIPKKTSADKKKKRKIKGSIAAVIACGLLSGAIGSGLTALTITGFFSPAANTVTLTNASSPISVTNVSTQIGQPLTVTEISARVSPAVVSIIAKVTVTDRFGRSETSSGSGSGILVAEDGYILTNNHVIEGASTLTVKLSTGAEYPASVIGADSQTDLAVLKIKADNLPFVTLGDSDSLQVGDLAIAIGNPLGELTGTVTTGIISATDREITIDGEKMNLLQTDAAINPGNSGGALCNVYGEVIGVVNAKTSALGVEGLGFVIPINDAKPVMEQLIENGYVAGRAEMGVSLQEVTEQTAKFFRMEAGVYVSSVTSGEAADKAGIKTGDRIVSVDGEILTSAVDLKEIIQNHSAGDQLAVILDRNGVNISVTVTLKESLN